jgi:hypothetical protein
MAWRPTSNPNPLSLFRPLLNTFPRCSQESKKIFCKRRLFDDPGVRDNNGSFPDPA